MPQAGARGPFVDNIYESAMGYWSSTIIESKFGYLWLEEDNCVISTDSSANGKSVRCIKD
ncbi:hypothetical protein MASR2M117_16010 [Paludibacter sp.]